MPTCSIVIISYNGKKFLRKCLLAVYESYVNPFQIIIVDDFSGDGTEKMIRSEFSAVEYIRNEENLGPTISRNKGAQIANGDYILFLDNDILIKKNSLKILTKFFANRPKTGIVGAKIIPVGGDKMWWNAGWNMNHFRQSVGYFVGFLLKIFPKSRFLKKMSMKFILNYWDYNEILKVDWVIEGCFMVRRDVFNQVGGFDENFFMGHEGPDLALRIRKIGYDIYFNPNAQVDDLNSHTHDPVKRKLWLWKGEYYFYKKHYFYLKSNPILFFLGRIISGLFYLIA